MSTKWFVYQNETVSGPFTSDEVKARVQSDVVNVTDLIWGQGLNGWQSVRWWQTELPKIGETVIATTTNLIEMWHYALEGKSHGPFNRASLVDSLKGVPNIGDVMLWTKGMKEWAPVFEFHDLLNEVGANKRIFPRAELDGKAIIKADGITLLAPLLTISEGGMGVQLDAGLVSGQTCTIEVQSPAFKNQLMLRAEVRYAAGGVIGLRFISPSAEAKNAILTYVRQNQTRFVLKAA